MNLTTPEFVQQVVPDLTPAEIEQVPGLIESASGAIRRWCDRELTFAAGIEEIATPDGSGTIILARYPVATVRSVLGTPATALTIRRMGQVQWARATILDPDADTAIVGTRLDLEAKAAGRVTTTGLDFADLADPTVAAVAAWVNALPGGWLAEFDPMFRDHGAADLVAGRGSQPAAGAGATFQLFADDLPFGLDKEAGIVTIRRSGAVGPSDGPRFGPSSFAGDDDIRPGESGVRVTYDAGYRVVPADLQRACAEVVKATLERFGVSSVLQSEKTDLWSWTARQFGELIGGMPEPVRQAIATYRSNAR